jgi:hypothetical protein
LITEKDMVTEDRLKRIRASICLLPDPGYEVARELLEEIARLREGLRLITCESVNAEYMAQNILDGLPAYHDTMLVPNETPNAELTGAAPLYGAASSDRRERG